MLYPSAEEYMRAVQSAESFTAKDLERVRLVVHPVFRVPAPAAGTSAVVFQASIDGEAQALRFFTREDAFSGERYTALHDHFATRGLNGSVAMPRWIDDGIKVNGRTWPVVRMQWVDGHTLNRHVEGLVRQRDTRSLESLAGAWRGLVSRLQAAEFAHGDLQHGNVLVDSRGQLRLVDFDCSWIARFDGYPAPSETGHRNYQLDHRPWGRWMDTFSGLVIYTSLLALSKNPNPWHALHTGENLLFRHEDFRAPFATPTWEQLASIGDTQLDELVARLRECCTPGWVPGALDDLLAPRAKQWWELTPAAMAASAATESPTPPKVTVPPTMPRRPTPPRRPATPAPRQPGGNWWEPATLPRTPAKTPSVMRIIGAAVVLGFLATWLLVAIGEAAFENGAFGVVGGLATIVLTVIIGFRRRR